MLHAIVVVPAVLFALGTHYALLNRHIWNKQPILHRHKIRFEFGPADFAAESMRQIFGPTIKHSKTTRVEILASGLNWTEGPLYVGPSPGRVLFSDTEQDRIYVWEKNSGTARILHEPGGGLDEEEVRSRLAEPGPNGLLLHPIEKYLVAMQHGARRVAKIVPDKSGSLRQSTLVDSYRGSRLHSPNDGVYSTIKSRGTLFFTDPPYGLRPVGSTLHRQVFLDSLPQREMSYSGVYALPPGNTSEPILLLQDLPRPNGIALSVDESVLYVGNSGYVDPVRAKASPSVGGAFVNAYDVVYDEGTGLPTEVVRPRTIVNFAAVHNNLVRGNDTGTVDGLAVDDGGRLYVAGPGGVFIFAIEASSGSSSGRIRTISTTYIGTIVSETKVGNVAIGSDGGLYVCGHRHVFRMQTNVGPAAVVEDASGTFPVT